MKLGGEEFINFVEVGGKFINFVEIGGICNMHLWLNGDGRPWVLDSTMLVNLFLIALALF